MKLSKDDLFYIFDCADDHDRCVQGGLDMDDVKNAFIEGTLEIEGYVRADHFADDSKMGWTKFDPQDPKTFPPETDYYIVSIVEQDFTETFYFDGRDDTVRDWTGEVTHWRPLPKPPVESEAGK